MNSESSPTPQEELEVQITALLLGELPEEQAAAFRERIAADPGLRKLHTRIGMTIGLVKEAVTSPPPTEIEAPKGMKLSEERREKLLASFRVVKVPEREARFDFKTWGALAAMIAGLLTFSYWVMGAVFMKARHSAQPMAAAGDADAWSSPFQSEPPSLMPVPAHERTLYSRRSLKENAPPDTVSSREVEQGAEASAAKGEWVEGNRLDRSRIELPTILAHSEARSEPEISDPAWNGVLENPASAGPKAQSTTMLGYFDNSAAGQTAPGLKGGTAPAATSGTVALGIAPAMPARGSESYFRNLGQKMQGQIWASDSLSTDKAVQDPNLNGHDEGRFGGGIEFAEAKSAESGANFDSRQLGEAAVAANPGDDRATALAESLGQVNGHAEGRLAANSGMQADRLQELEKSKKVPSGLTAGSAEDGQAYGPPAFSRENPELIKRYFPHLAAGMPTQQKSPSESAAARPAIGEIDKLERDVKRQEEALHSILGRVETERVDAAIDIAPERRVQIVQQAEPKEMTLWERLRGGAERKAVIATTKDGPGVGSILAQGQVAGYDPYFIQTEAEKVKSTSVLGDVVDKLNLSQEWGNKAGGQNLGKEEAIHQLRNIVNAVQNSSGLLEIMARSKNPEEAARIANAVAEVYQERRNRAEGLSQKQVLQDELAKQKSALDMARAELQKAEAASKVEPPVAKPVANAPVPQPEVVVATNPFSTFSLNVSDVSFKLAAASLEKGVMPEAAGIRSEEFINAFDYRDPVPVSAPIAFAWERARYPFAHNRDLLRFSVKTAASGREAGRPLNLVLLLDSSGSMERSDRVRIIQECLRVLAGQLQAQDKVSVVTFARTPRLWADGLAGSAAGELVERIVAVTPEGGTNLEEAMRVGYETAARHFLANGVNRVVLLTDGAANLGGVKADSLKQRVEENRRKGIALDCFGIGWEGLNDDLLEQLSRNGDGRYGFVNSPESANAEFAGQLAGALKVAASDVKVQVEFNPKRTTVYRQIGYAKHQLTKEQFRDNTVDAAEIGAAEAGNALYVVQTNPAGEGPIATVRVRFKVPGSNDYREHEWLVPYEGAANLLERSSPGIRLAATASGFSELLAASPYAGEISPGRLLGILSRVPEAFPNDPRPKQLEWMIRQAKSIAGQ